MHVPVECYSDFSEEYLQILPAETLLRHILDFLQHLTTGSTRFSVYPSERKIIISWLEIRPLLLYELRGEPSNNSCNENMYSQSHMDKERKDDEQSASFCMI